MNKTITKNLTVSASTALISTVLVKFVAAGDDFNFIVALLIILLFSTAAVFMVNKTEPVEELEPAFSSENVELISDERESGSVKWFNVSKGFGFITRENGEDVFVHFRSIRGQGHRFLTEGQAVEFSLSEGRKGLQAEDVTRL